MAINTLVLVVQRHARSSNQGDNVAGKDSIFACARLSCKRPNADEKSEETEKPYPRGKTEYTDTQCVHLGSVLRNDSLSCREFPYADTRV